MIMDLKGLSHWCWGASSGRSHHLSCEDVAEESARPLTTPSSTYLYVVGIGVQQSIWLQQSIGITHEYV